MSIIDEAKKKLHSENGSSLLIALLLFFVCLILSMSILSAAVASRVRIKDEKEKNQELLCLESALGVLTEGLGDIKYYRKEKKLGSGEWQKQNSWIEISGKLTEGKLEAKLDSLMGQYLQDKDQQEEFRIYVKDSDKVYIHPKVEKDYYLVFYVGFKSADDAVYKISYSPNFTDYFGDALAPPDPDGQTGWRLSATGDTKELCIIWKKDFYTIQRVVD